MPGTRELLTRESLQRCNERTAEALRQRISHLRKHLEKSERKSLEAKALIKTLNLRTSESDFSRFMSGERPMLPARDHYAVVSHLFLHGYWTERPETEALNKIPDHFYFATTLFLNIGVATQDNTTNRAAGIYRFWRPSFHSPGDFVFGAMHIYEALGTHALRTAETQKFSGSDNSRKLTEVHEGYLFRKDKKYFILSHDEPAKRHLRVTIVHGVRHEGKQISAMRGAVFGLDMKDIYAAPIYLERVDEAKRDELHRALDLVAKESVPRTVLNYLDDFAANRWFVRF